MRQFIYYLTLQLLLIPSLVAAELLPEQLAVIANSASPESLRVARHYAKVRGLPEKHILQVTLPPTETIDRQAFDERLILSLREQLVKRELANVIRVLVTTYGIPLRVKPPDQNDADKEIILKAISQQNYARMLLTKISEKAALIAGGTPLKEQPRPSAKEAEDSKKLDQERINRAREQISNAGSRIRSLADQQQRQAGINNLSLLVIKYGGLTALLKNLNKKDGVGSEQVEQTRVKLNQEIRSGQQLLRALEQTSSPENRKRTYAIVQHLFGAVGVLSRATKEIEDRSYQLADASVDSELSLLWWDRDMYPLSGRLPNPFFSAARSTSPITPPTSLPIIMVSRIDAPSAKQALRLIDRTLEAENKGLKGKAYIDSRGLAFKAGDTFAIWDQNLRDLSQLLRKATSFQVHTDKEQDLIKEAPDTALYVGWYQLRKYHDVFTFAPGAIAYHIASEEAVSIHNKEETGWCKNLLERGVSVTVGAVAEPYLESFPLPQEFFALLLSGLYSLVEAYYLSTPFISWRMVLFGDPLYQPWQGKTLVSLDDLTLRSARDKELKAFPTPPAELPFLDPLQARKKIEENRKQLGKRIDAFFENLEKQKENRKPK